MIETRVPRRPLLWPDLVYELQDIVIDLDQPVYIVGGAVRDAYLHRPIHDLDLATPADAIPLARKLANRLKCDIFVLDAERDVARVLPKSSPEGRIVMDIARFRQGALLEDLTDRDFTINAMAVDLRGNVGHLIDPLNGENDLADRILRQCGSQSLSDDPIRTLRAVRQSVQFNARIEPATLGAIRANAPNLMTTSTERVRDEFFKLLANNRPALALRIAETVGLLHQIIPEVEPLQNLTLPVPHVYEGWKHTLSVVEKLRGLLDTLSYHRSDETAAAFDLGMVAVALDRFRQPLQAHLDATGPEERPHRSLLVLGALLHQVSSLETGQDNVSTAERSAAMAETRATALRLSNRESVRLGTMIRFHNQPLELPRSMSDLDIHRFWWKTGTGGIDACLLALANYLGTVGTSIDQDTWIQHVERVQQLFTGYFERHEQLVTPPQLVNGNDLMQTLNIKPGKQIAELLDLIREGQVTGEIQSADDAFEAARQRLLQSR